MGAPATECKPDNTLSSPQATETDGEAKDMHNQSTGTMKPFHFQIKETLYENKFCTILSLLPLLTLLTIELHDDFTMTDPLRLVSSDTAGFLFRS